jgi:hypothetical protein
MVRDVSWKPLFYSPIISKSAHFAQKLALLILLNVFFLFVHEILRTFATVKLIDESILGRAPVFRPLHNGRAFLMPNTLYMAAGGFRENYTLFRIVSIEFANGD